MDIGAFLEVVGCGGLAGFCFLGWVGGWCPEPELNRHDLCDREILSLLCLPIPPSGRVFFELEARVGIEPAYTELQSAA